MKVVQIPVQGSQGPQGPPGPDGRDGSDGRNSLDTDSSLETSMARKEFVWVSIVIKHDHSAGVYYDTPTTPLNDESIATLEAIKAYVRAAVPGSDFNYIYDSINQVRYESYNIIDPSMQHDVIEAFFEAASVGNTSSVIREVKYTTMNQKFSAHIAHINLILKVLIAYRLYPILVVLHKHLLTQLLVGLPIV